MTKGPLELGLYVMWKTLSALIGIGLCVGGQKALAAVDCGRQPELVPNSSAESFKADASGKAQLFSRVLPQAEIKGNVEIGDQNSIKTIKESISNKRMSISNGSHQLGPLLYQTKANPLCGVETGK